MLSRCGDVLAPPLFLSHASTNSASIIRIDTTCSAPPIDPPPDPNPPSALPPLDLGGLLFVSTNSHLVARSARTSHAQTHGKSVPTRAVSHILPLSQHSTADNSQQPTATRAARAVYQCTAPRSSSASTRPPTGKCIPVWPPAGPPQSPIVPEYHLVHDTLHTTTVPEHTTQHRQQ